MTFTEHSSQQQKDTQVQTELSTKQTTFWAVSLNTRKRLQGAPRKQSKSTLRHQLTTRIRKTDKTKCCWDSGQLNSHGFAANVKCTTFMETAWQFTRKPTFAAHPPSNSTLTQKCKLVHPKNCLQMVTAVSLTAQSWNNPNLHQQEKG